MTEETRVKKLLKKQIEIQKSLYGDELFFTTYSDRYRSGMPDSFLIIKGVIVFIECKSAKKKLTPIQRVMRDRLQAAGATYLVYRGENDMFDLPSE